MGPTLGQAIEAGWRVALKCERRRAGLKSVRACPLPTVLDLRTLVAAFGPDVAMSELQHKLMCPRCGSDRFVLAMHAPPIADAGKADAQPVRRKMRPATAHVTLGSSPEPWICFECPKCGRAGQSRRADLVKEFGPDIDLPSFLPIFASARGCKRAIPNPDRFDLSRENPCHIRYVVDG